MSKEQDLKQEQNNLVHTYGLLSLRMEEVQSQARQIEQQMIKTKNDIRENIEKQNVEETTENEYYTMSCENGHIISTIIKSIEEGRVEYGFKCEKCGSDTDIKCNKEGENNE